VRRALVEAAQAGDHEAFEVLAAGVVDRLFGIARLVLRDVPAAQDAVQETLVSAWKDLPRLRDPERFDAWIHRLLINACADQGRLRRRWTAEIQVVRALPSSDGGFNMMDDRDQLERGFKRLKTDQRVAFVLHHYLGLTVPEIAETLGIPEGTVKSRLYYATGAMRAALEADARRPAIATNRRSA